ncbi:2-ketoglutarate ferredoxin oxidoreductase subunit alpha [Haloarcula hispanica N601]|uniref:2-oxoglutarate synthase subunit KorA n=3 Tax=Haloarcula hispanica TaxID=51589 RepID=A0A482TAP6_HALHI|nr:MULTISPECIES: 2-oxoacid:acceptor oxidoreductase subunit alpha [Haloarcula]AEM57460.1 2-oxoglutarate ferredoxin oxidoreductase subunit alpha [Haloarcula hispanica ATCC 33960]AHB66224.1 2-ketoglutarate ferredoxin oxidoreductase subunit alpha [Haloarcula hispanica N601]AJF24539.1 2-ketoglutarate ferredoxin oxidoreductase subunit alpha [Haloarcula sp. CBA1115]KAA9410120.1 2-oxoacid:acceptor oxidoreductase subunit alpha [Haloarcula hispanica]KZX49639.1 2-ketoglutarate ferredoxin oxidoreductase s
MTDNELIWRIAGGSGDGIDSTSQNFAKALMWSGLNVFTHRHYPSRIRGGHTYVEVRAKDEPVQSRGDGYNFLLALGDSFARNPQEEAYYGKEELKPLYENFDDLREGGVLLYDEGLLDEEDVDEIGLEEAAEENNWHVVPMDLRGIAKEHGREIMRNTAGIGATAAILDISTDEFEKLIKQNMSGDMQEANLNVLHDAYEAASELDIDHDIEVPEGSHDEEQVILSGSNAISYGAIDEGCRFISGYPMTPWTDVFTIMSQHLPSFGGISEQVEDEIAAAALALGASHAGVKAMSGSSGGGFALMSEPLGLAEMTETPIVLVEAMRAGPSTGMPTKPEQADLEHVLYTSQGDSARVVFAPANIRECYTQTRSAFRIAYEYQIPAIVIYDQKIQGELRNLPASHFDEEPNADPGSVLTEEEIQDAAHHSSGKFQRFLHEPEDGSNVSPRSVPGQKDGRFLATGNEHNPSGHISEDPENRIAQMNRRLNKLDDIRADLDENTSHQTYHGPDEADYGILVWGSQQGTVFEAVDRLNENGHSVKALGVSDMAPYPKEEVSEWLESVDEALVVEMNATAQFRGLTQKELGKYGDKMSSLLKYNGNPFEPAEIVDGFESSIDGEELAASNMKYVPAAGD